MALVRWEPFRELAALQNEMNRWVGQLAGPAPAGNGPTSTWAPAVDVWETDGELVLSFELPGIAEDNITVELDDSVLTVSGERDRANESLLPLRASLRLVPAQRAAARRREREGDQGRLPGRRPRSACPQARGGEAEADPDRLAGHGRGQERAPVAPESAMDSS